MPRKKQNNQTCTRCWSWDNLIYLRTAKRQRFSCYRNLLCSSKIKINRTSTAPGDVKLQFGLGPGNNLSHASEQVNERVTQLVSERKYARLSGWALKVEELKKTFSKSVVCTPLGALSGPGTRDADLTLFRTWVYLSGKHHVQRHCDRTRTSN